MLKVNKRIGLATTEDGSYIYVCPGHKDIITVLAKYGFWKGASTIDTNQDSLIGFVVRDRKPPVNTSKGEVSIEKIQEIGGTHMKAQEVIYGKLVLSISPHAWKSYSLDVLLYSLLIMDIILLFFQISDHTLFIPFVHQ